MIWSSAKPANVQLMLEAVGLLPPPPPPPRVDKKKKNKKAIARDLAWTGFSEEETVEKDSAYPEEWTGFEDGKSAVGTVQSPNGRAQDQQVDAKYPEEWNGIEESHSPAVKIKLPTSRETSKAKTEHEEYPEWKGIEDDSSSKKLEDGPAWTGFADEPVIGKLNESLESLAIAIAKQVYPPLVAVWARDRLNLSAADFHRKVQTVKDLKQVWDEIEGHWDQSNTVLVDDAIEKAVSSFLKQTERLRVPTEYFGSAYNLTTFYLAKHMTLSMKSYPPQLETMTTC